MTKDPGKKVTAADLIASASAQASPYASLRTRIAQNKQRYSPSIHAPEIYLYAPQQDTGSLQAIRTAADNGTALLTTGLNAAPKLQDMLHHDTVTLYCELSDPPITARPTRDAQRIETAETFARGMCDYFSQVIGVPDEAIRYHMQAFTKEGHPHSIILAITMPQPLREAAEAFVIDMGHPPPEYFLER